MTHGAMLIDIGRFWLVFIIGFVSGRTNRQTHLLLDSRPPYSSSTMESSCTVRWFQPQRDVYTEYFQTEPFIDWLKQRWWAEIEMRMKLLGSAAPRGRALCGVEDFTCRIENKESSVGTGLWTGPICALGSKSPNDLGHQRRWRRAADNNTVRRPVRANTGMSMPLNNNSKPTEFLRYYIFAASGQASTGDRTCSGSVDWNIVPLPVKRNPPHEMSIYWNKREKRRRRQECSRSGLCLFLNHLLNRQASSHVSLAVPCVRASALPLLPSPLAVQTPQI